VPLLAAFDHAGGAVLGQTQVEWKSNELIGRCAAPGRAAIHALRIYPDGP
jgi:hypothetical protein